MNRTTRLITAVEHALRAPSVHKHSTLAVADRGRHDGVARRLEPAPDRH
jgi:hypothetical protein